MQDENGPDPITRQIVQNYLTSAADTMAVTVVRTARSAVVKDGMDFSTGIFNAEGELVAQGLTLPFHMGAMQPALDAIRAYYGDDIKPGDIFANNDPYEGASHLPDIFLFKPVFYNEALVSWTCVIAHHTDIGGRVAGGNACDNTEIYQEGLRIPPIKLIEEGEMNHAVWRIINKNVRVPDMVQGDILAQISALHQGERDLLRLVEEYGIEDASISSGPLKDLNSITRPPNTEHQRVVQGVVDDLYQRFVTVVRESRGKRLKKPMEEVADGRIYTASQAKEVGLVDRIGYFEDALDELRRLSGVSEFRVITLGHQPDVGEPNIYMQQSARPGANLGVISALAGLRQSSAPFYYLWLPR
ncbi:MAG: hydantoinase B/oxoprolinase family protein [Chloroflexi bacterium]|nr:hydantoinase B/oxoprolinase family protein [Chloroflexota bacterium]